MASIRISGIVREARRFQQILSRPLSVAQRERLAAELEQLLAGIDAILRARGRTAACLPAPSRRAWAFLKSLDIRTVPVLEDAPLSPPELREVRLPGLDSYLTRFLDASAAAIAEGRDHLPAMLAAIRRTRDRLEEMLEQTGPSVVLPPPQAELAAWFRVFAAEHALREYVEAVRRATAILGGATSRRVPWRLPLYVQFRPLRPMCRWRMLGDGSRMTLQTAMVTFDRAAFGLLARLLTGDRRARRELHEIMVGPAFRGFQERLLAAAPDIERTAGMTYDLAAVFERVNLLCFGGNCPRPRLRWSRTLAVRQWGQYQPVQDTVTVSRALDQPHVPEYVVDYIMYHELLHKVLGGRFDGDRERVHTPEFREAERRFPRRAEAEAWLAIESASWR